MAARFQAGAIRQLGSDIWKNCNPKQAAVDRYLATAEVRNFVVTNLVAEIANFIMSCWRWMQ